MFETVWKTVLFVTPYIRVKRGCAGMKTSTPLTAWRAVHRQSGTAFQADLFMEILYPRAFSPSSSMHLGYSWCCLPGNNEQAKLELIIN